jgi:hypothetical protein
MIVVFVTIAADRENGNHRLSDNVSGKAIRSSPE